MFDVIRDEWTYTFNTELSFVFLSILSTDSWISLLPSPLLGGMPRRLQSLSRLPLPLSPSRPLQLQSLLQRLLGLQILLASKA